MKISELNGAFYCHQSQFIGGTDTGTCSDTATRHPNRKSRSIMLSPEVSLTHRSSSKLTCPNHQCRFEKSSLFQIREQPRDPLIGPLGSRFVILNQFGMRIPSIFVGHIVQLDKANPAFHQSARHEALARETRGPCFWILNSV